MKDHLINFIWKIAALNPAFAKVVAGVGMTRASSYLSEVGWYESFQRRMPVDRCSRPIPWYSYPSLRFLEERVNGQWSVFEFGCGNSTRWWGERVSRVVSCEHDAGWYGRVQQDLPHNSEAHLKGGLEYASFIREYANAFDEIVIDGVDRVECALNCLDALKEDGVIIWDNSDRKEYQAGYDYLVGKGFRRLNFSGLGPIVMIPTETAVFYRQNNCLGL